MQNYNNRSMMNMPDGPGPTRFNTIGIDSLPDRFFTNARVRWMTGNQAQFGTGFTGFVNSPFRFTGGMFPFAAGSNRISGGCGCRRGF